MRARVVASMLATLALVTSSFAIARPPTPAPSASAAASASAAPAASAAAKPDADALPPGHPAVEDQLPPGHPAVGGEDEDDDAPPPNPHGGPHGQAGHGEESGEDRIFKPPADGAQDDPSLPAGTIVVSIRDAQDRPIPGAPVTLGVLHASVAKGESRERKAKETDERGEARFDGLALGSGTTYRVSTTRGPATYAAMPFPLGDKIGKRAVVHSYEVSSDLGGLMLGSEAIIYVALREDALAVEQLLSVYNLGPVAWIADTSFSLPAGFHAFNKQDSMDDARVEEVSGQGAALRGTFSPGRHDLDFRYQVTLDDKERQTLRVELPPRVAVVKIMVESSKTMGLEVPDFPAAQRTQNREGKRVLVTQLVTQRDDISSRTIELTLTGLPTPGPGRWIAVALGALALAAGISTLLKKQDGTLDPDAKKDLEDAREALLAEIVSLERMHREGEVGPKTYERVRASLLDALARVVDKLEAAESRNKKPKPKAKRAGKPARRLA